MRMAIISADSLHTLIFFGLKTVFCFSFCNTHLGCNAFLSFKYDLSSRNLSFFPSSLLSMLTNVLSLFLFSLYLPDSVGTKH